ncbi:alpha/beta hydrolase [Longimicrobium sp.]|uniref:alpha/beta hydrolase n=1 Tax=Longimicrobium sp. TaxID=2029185 RepID=UPI002E3013E6|nr:dienelactone hydrolase family protein [Longimicrobium sp.]HEX6036865.1 dienelactone hydrolase family protein [Longimicrobium sp.]
MRIAFSLARGSIAAALLALAAAPACAQAPASHGDAIAAGTFAYDRAAPLDLRDSLETVQDGLETHAISFVSPRGGRVTGLLFVPQGPGKKAGIVAMHGSPGSARQSARNSEGLARRGAVVVAIDAPFARRPGEPSLTFTPSDSADQVQVVVDLQRAVDLLLARADVDPARIAFVGGSYGAAVGTMYAAVDPRPAAYVLFVPDGGSVSHFTDQDGQRDSMLSDMPEADWQRWTAAMRPVEGIHYVGRIREGSVLFQNGLRDQFIPAWKAQELHRAAGPSHTVRWYDARHGLTTGARLDRYAWLAERIGIRAPTDEERAAAAQADAEAAR